MLILGAEGHKEQKSELCGLVNLFEGSLDCCEQVLSAESSARRGRTTRSSRASCGAW